jgi:hypothetical protein
LSFNLHDEGAVAAEGLVEEWLDGDGAAVGAMEEAFALERVEIATDGDDGDLELLAERVDGDGPGLVKDVEDGLITSLLFAFRFWFLPVSQDSGSVFRHAVILLWLAVKGGQALG